MHARVLLLALCFACPAVARADAPIAFLVGRLHPVSSAPIDQAVMIVQNGKIVAVGTQKEVTIPEGAERHELPNAVIIPGLVDTHSHIGIYPRPSVPAHSDGNEMSGPVQSGIRALDAIFPDDPGIRMAVAGGVTTANIMPGSGNVIGGQTLYVKLRGRTVEQMQIVGAKVVGGLKMANGENPKGYGRNKGVAPFTRMKVASLQREQFVKAREYQQKWQRYREVEGDKKGPMPDRDINLEPLVEVLERKRTVHFHCHRADDLLTAMRIAEEFDFEIVLQHATEGYRVVDELVAKKIPVSLTLVDSPGGKAEVMGLLEENAGILDQKGVLVALNTDDSVTESRFFLRTGSMAVRGGMSESSALKAITLNAAKMMHLDHQLGTLEKGKDADFVILSGAPFSVYTQVLETYIDGQRHFQRGERRDWSYQSGGYDLRDLTLLPPTPAPQTPLKFVSPPDMKNSENGTRTSDKRIIVAGRIHTATGEPLLDSVIMIEKGKITQVTPRKGFMFPEGVPVLTVAEVTPGLIDAHTVVGLSGAMNIPADQDQDERSDPLQSELRVIDAFNPNEPLLEFLCREGVTTIHAMPGRVNVIAGQTGIFRTHGRSVEAMTVQFPAGLLVNLGEVPKESFKGKMPDTRMGTAQLIRKTFAEAQDYRTKRAMEGDKKAPRSLKYEALMPMLEGKRPVYFSAHRADDLVTALRIAEEFKLQPVLSLATEGYLVSNEIQRSKAKVVVHPTMQRIASSMETVNSSTVNTLALQAKRIPFAICTAFEGYVPKTRMLRAEMSVAMSQGLGPNGALRAVTIDAAELLGIADRYGSIAVGKVADLVLFDGDPFENATHVQFTIMDGQIVYDRAEYLKLPFARRALAITGGGFGTCCQGQ